MKDGTAGAAGADMSAAAAWSSAAALQPTAGYYGYDHPTLAAYGYVINFRYITRRAGAEIEISFCQKRFEDLCNTLLTSFFPQIVMQEI